MHVDGYIGGRIMNQQKIRLKMMEIIRKRNEIENKLNANISSIQTNQFSSVFNYVLKSLHGEYREIIERSFIYCSFKYWWNPIYSKSSFYRLREKALNSFVSLFEMIYENIENFTY